MTAGNAQESARLPLARSDHLVRATATVAIAVTMAAMAFLAWWIRNVLLLVFAGVLFAILLHGLSERLQRWSRMPYRISLAIVLILLAVVAGLAISLVGAQIYKQVSQLIETLPETLHNFRETLLQTAAGRWLLSQTSESSGQMSGRSLLPRLTGITTAGLSFVGGVAVIFFVGLYGAVEPRFYRSGILHLVPKQHRGRADEVLEILRYSLWWWMISRFVSMCVVGVLTTLGLWSLGIPMPFALGFIAFVLVMIPNVGPIMAAVPAILAASQQGAQSAGYVVILYVAIETVESYMLLPWLERRTVYQPPVISIASIVLFGVISGILGALVASPLMVAVIVLVKLLYVESTLGDYDVHVPGEDEA